MQVLSAPELTTAVKDASKQHLRNQGRHLWRGVYSVIVGAGPAHAVHFATYEYCKEKLSNKLSNHTKIPVTSFEISSTLLASGGAGAIATFSHDLLMTPFDGK
jgi:solute carrier family 25 iron transporter 28/37